MSDIYINVENEIATGTCDDTITSGDVNSVTVHFTFDDAWDDTVKTAVFYTNNDTEDFYAQLLDEDDTCLVPEEVLTLPCRLFIGVFGDKDNTRITSSYVKVRIKKGTDTSLAIEIATVDLYGQIVQKLADITELASTLEATELPEGGSAGQVLSKASDSDYDTEWVDDKSEEIEALNTDLKELTENYNNHQHDHVETDYADTSKLGLTELNGIPYYKQNSDTEYTYPDSLVYKSDFESVEGATEFEGVECVALDSDTAYIGSVHDGEMGMSLRMYTNYDEQTVRENYATVDNSYLADITSDTGMTLSFQFKTTDIPRAYDADGNEVNYFIQPLVNIIDGTTEDDTTYGIIVALEKCHQFDYYTTAAGLRVAIINSNYTNYNLPASIFSRLVTEDDTFFDNDWHNISLGISESGITYTLDGEAVESNASGWAYSWSAGSAGGVNLLTEILDNMSGMSNIQLGAGYNNGGVWHFGSTQAGTDPEMVSRDAQDLSIRNFEIYNEVLDSDTMMAIQEYETSNVETRVILYPELRQKETEIYAYTNDVKDSMADEITEEIADLPITRITESTYISTLDTGVYVSDFDNDIYFVDDNGDGICGNYIIIDRALELMYVFADACIYINDTIGSVGDTYILGNELEYTDYMGVWDTIQNVSDALDEAVTYYDEQISEMQETITSLEERIAALEGTEE